MRKGYVSQLTYSRIITTATNEYKIWAAKSSGTYPPTKSKPDYMWAGFYMLATSFLISVN